MIIHTMPMAIETMMRRHVPFSFAIRSLCMHNIFTQFVCINMQMRSSVTFHSAPLAHFSPSLLYRVTAAPSSDHILSEIMKFLSSVVFLVVFSVRARLINSSVHNHIATKCKMAWNSKLTHIAHIFCSLRKEHAQNAINWFRNWILHEYRAWLVLRSCFVLLCAKSNDENFILEKSLSTFLC